MDWRATPTCTGRRTKPCTATRVACTARRCRSATKFMWGVVSDRTMHCNTCCMHRQRCHSATNFKWCGQRPNQYSARYVVGVVSRICLWRTTHLSLSLAYVCFSPIRSLTYFRVCSLHSLLALYFSPFRFVFSRTCSHV
jgi:hypothetical protein